MTSTLIIVVLAVVFGVLLFLLIAVVASVVVKAMEGPLKERMLARYPQHDVLLSDLRANSFGLESRGAMQARGNGALVLTAKELCFFQVMPRREDLVPLSAITETSLARSHLGKATPFPLIKVSFAGASGPDSIAVLVKDAAQWQRTIDEARAKAS